MKIIAKTGSGFLLEATENEIAACCGFRQPYGKEWEAFVGKHGVYERGGRMLGVGSEFHPKQISDWHYNIQYKMKQVTEAAGFLTSLAEMMKHPPDAFTIPPTEAEITAATKTTKGENE